MNAVVVLSPVAELSMNAVVVLSPVAELSPSCALIPMPEICPLQINQHFEPYQGIDQRWYWQGVGELDQYWSDNDGFATERAATAAALFDLLRVIGHDATDAATIIYEQGLPYRPYAQYFVAVEAA